MQTRIKEIRDRVDKSTDWRVGREDLINNACEDIQYLLDALEQAQEENKQLLDERQSVDVYRDQFIKILQKNTDLWEKERVLRDALGTISSESKNSVDTAFIYNVHSYISTIKLIHITAKEALKNYIAIDCFKCGYRIGLFTKEEIKPYSKESQFECPKCLTRFDVVKQEGKI